MVRTTSSLAGFALAILTLSSALASHVALTSSSAAQAPVDASDRIVVLVRGLRSNRGVVVGSLFDSAASWLREGQSIADCRARVRGGTARCVFSVAQDARVAFAGFHDEDEDGVFDRDVFGLPQEGYLFSNDVREPFGPPSFAAAAFVAPREAAFAVQARYGL